MDVYAAYQRFKQEYIGQEAVRKSLAEELAEKREQLAAMKHYEETLQQVSRLFLMAAEYARANAKATMEKIVTTGLRGVFPGDLSFEIELDNREDRPEASFLVASTYGGTLEVKNEPRDARGGGIVDIISLALRVAMLETSEPEILGPLVLDEPAKHVSEEYMPGVGEFLRRIYEAFERQIIMVTHNQELAAMGDCCYVLRMHSGETEASPLTIC